MLWYRSLCYNEFVHFTLYEEDYVMFYMVD